MIEEQQISMAVLQATLEPLQQPRARFGSTQGSQLPLRESLNPSKPILVFATCGLTNRIRVCRHEVVLFAVRSLHRANVA